MVVVTIRKSTAVLVLAALVVAAGVAFLAWLVYSSLILLRPADGIRMLLLEETPIGTPIEDVRKSIAAHGWVTDPAHQENLGFHKDEGASRVIGSYSIHASLGSHRGIPFRVFVSAYWGFDKDGKLTDIRVRKDADAL